MEVMTTMLRRIPDFIAMIGGANADVLQKVPSERSRFVQMALVLFTTAGIAVVSMSFALHDGVKAPWAWAVFLGVLWGGVILNIDRFLVLSIGATRDRGRLLLMALPRVAMAVLLAVVISTPLVLRVFARDIKAQMIQMQLATSHKQGTLLANSKEQKEANRLLRQITADQQILAGQLPVKVTSPALQKAQAAVSSLQQAQQADQKAVIAAREAWQCELYGDGPGCAGASNKPGAGPIAAAKHQQYLTDLSRLKSVDSQLNTAQAQLNSAKKAVAKSSKNILTADQNAAREALPGLQSQYKSLENYLRKKSAQGTRANDNNNGLLMQIQALFQISSQNSALAYAHWAVFLLFFMVEILPVSVKLLLNFGPITTYETVAKLMDDERADRARTARNAARKIEEGKSRVRVKVEDHMRLKEEELGKEVNEYVAAEMKSILQIALQAWSARVQARLNGAQAIPAVSGSGSASAGTTGAGQGTPSPNGPAGSAPGGQAQPGGPGQPGGAGPGQAVPGTQAPSSTPGGAPNNATVHSAFKLPNVGNL